MARKIARKLSTITAKVLGFAINAPCVPLLNAPNHERTSAIIA
jgi:hypothetical protein